MTTVQLLPRQRSSEFQVPLSYPPAPVAFGEIAEQVAISGNYLERLKSGQPQVIPVGAGSGHRA
jgi:hypothetical protein